MYLGEQCQWEFSSLVMIHFNAWRLPISAAFLNNQRHQCLFTSIPFKVPSLARKTLCYCCCCAFGSGHPEGGGNSVKWQSFVNHFFIPSCLLKDRKIFSTPCDRSSVNINPSHHQIAFLSSVFMLGLFGEIEEGIRREKRGKKLGLVVVAHLLVRFQPNHHLICKLIRTT